jgi:hypothetical protein
VLKYYRLYCRQNTGQVYIMEIKLVDMPVLPHAQGVRSCGCIK